MGILDKFTGRFGGAQKQPATTPSQPSLIDRGDIKDLDLPQRAQVLMAELVKSLDKPNQDIINDLIALVASLSSQQHPNINVSQVLQTSQALIHQLVSVIPDPDQRLIDELLHVIVLSATKSKQGNIAPPKAQETQVPNTQPQLPKGADANFSQTAPRINEVQQAQPPIPQQQPAPGVPAQPEQPNIQQAAAQQTPTTPAEQQTPQPQSNIPPEVKPEPKKEPPKKHAVAAPSKHMLNLVMDQLKELVEITNTLNTKVKESDEKNKTSISSLSETIDTAQKRVEDIDKKIAEIEKNMDKFIALYEIVTNQYNPFVESDDKPKEADNAPSTPPPPPVPMSTTPQEPEQQPEAPQAETPTPEQEPQPETITLDDLIKELKSTSEDEFSPKQAQFAEVAEALGAPIPEENQPLNEYVKTLIKFQIKQNIANKTS
jgi:hypothetical protein